jgi:hypothetical protein
MRAWLLAILMITGVSRVAGADAKVVDHKASDATQSITITRVTGTVQVRIDQTQPWRRAREGDMVSRASEFRTGPRSGLELRVSANRHVVIDGMTTIAVAAAIQRSEKRAPTTMPFGGSTYGIVRSEIVYGSTIRSPGSSLGGWGIRMVQLPDGRFVGICERISPEEAAKTLKRFAKVEVTPVPDKEFILRAKGINSIAEAIEQVDIYKAMNEYPRMGHRWLDGVSEQSATVLSPVLMRTLEEASSAFTFNGRNSPQSFLLGEESEDLEDDDSEETYRTACPFQPWDARRSSLVRRSVPSLPILLRDGALERLISLEQQGFLLEPPSEHVAKKPVRKARIIYREL